MSTSNRNIRFPGKFTGALAHLFAQACLHYSEAAQTECNDTPMHLPIFSWLSPQQRIALVADLVRGLLVPSEPLPPETMIHYAAYRGIVDTIGTELEIEMDDIYNRDVGKDLIPDSETMRIIRREEKGTLMSVERREEVLLERALNERIGIRNKKKLDKQGDSDATNNIAAVASSSNPNREELHHSPEQFDALIGLFRGGPATSQSRQHTRALTPSEVCYGFRWRLLCDAAFQEHRDKGPMSLCNLNFNWKSYAYKKWKMAVDLLLETFQGSADEAEIIFTHGEINQFTYADKKNHPRIKATKKMVKELRDSYDPSWDPCQRSASQREIFAICSCEIYGEPDHHLPWAEEFAARCNERDCNFLTPGNYDVRFAIHREIVASGQFGEGLEHYYHHSYGIQNTPADFVNEDEQTYSSCHSRGCWNLGNKPLQFCSACRVVKYCSKECQKKVGIKISKILKLKH